jgi:hypothetical protein
MVSDGTTMLFIVGSKNNECHQMLTPQRMVLACRG